MEWISVGDSPLFLFREGTLHRLNADHSLSPLIDARADRGEITREEAENHPDRHTLQAALLGMPLVWSLLLTTIATIWVFGQGYPLEAIFLSYISSVEPLHLALFAQRLADGGAETTGEIAADPHEDRR